MNSKIKWFQLKRGNGHEWLLSQLILHFLGSFNTFNKKTT